MLDTVLVSWYAEALSKMPERKEDVKQQLLGLKTI